MKRTLAIFLTVLMVFQMLSLFVAPISGERLNTIVKKEFVLPLHDEKLNNLFEIEYEDIIPGEILVKFKDGITENNIKSMNSVHGLSPIYKSLYSDFHRLKIPSEKSVAQMVEIYSKSPFVEYAEPNYIARICMTPNDPYYSYQWHLHDVDEGGIDMEPAWDISTGSGVTVAVLDTGIRAGTDLADTCFVDGYDFVNNDNNPIDDNGHGTHVAGTIAQSTNNNKGVAGVAYDACLMPVKVLDTYGYGTYADIIDGINYAVDNGAHIISMSFGGSSPSQGIEDALADAYNNDVTCIAASGNDNQNGILYPAAYDDYVIAVGATQYDKARAPYSNYGSSLDVVAPGGNLNLDQNDDGYGDGVLQQTFEKIWWWIQWGYYFFQGTSMATPHVSGTAALLYSDGVTTPDEIREALESTALDLGDSGWDMYYGYGLINAYDALQYSGSDSPPTCTITAPSNGATVSGDITIEVDASDDNGVSEVEFYVDSFHLGSDTSEPYSWTWDSTAV
ncbi:MAG: S8 family serine peptidase, partial [Thermoplasmatales archaeon]|nr:S8 family serine peptidase [Thermoplasmatales archaeon]